MWREKASSEYHCYSPRLDIDDQKGVGGLPVYTLLLGTAAISTVIPPLSVLVVGVLFLLPPLNKGSEASIRAVDFKGSTMSSFLVGHKYASVESYLLTCIAQQHREA
jgi:hypothetical protein